MKKWIDGNVLGKRIEDTVLNNRLRMFASKARNPCRLSKNRRECSGGGRAVT